jgi:hypothetical protein
MACSALFAGESGVPEITRATMKGTSIIILLIAALGSAAEAAVVSDTNIILSSGGGNADYALSVFKQETTNPTTMWFNLSGSTISFVTTNVDEGSDWYLASYGDPFTTETVHNGAFPVFVRDTSTGFDYNDLDVGGGDFYLGVNTGYGARLGMPTPRDVFGWVHLQNTNGTLTMLGNAVAYDEGGIVIGTTQTVPEPSPLPLLFLASLSFGILTRRHRGTEALSVASVSCC